MLKKDVIRVGTRGSDLALWQARHIIALLERDHPDVAFQIVEVSTRGDRDRETPLHRAGGVGLFVKGLEVALLNGQIDAAVHSLKDMPSRVPPDLALAAVPQRGDPRDTLVSAAGRTLMDLPGGARVGTGSPRRKAQILSLRPDVEVLGIRGNVDTRLRKVFAGDYDAVVLAAAGLIRLGREEAVTEWLSPETLLPAAGQGALAVEIRAGDEETQTLVAAANHRASRAAARAERSFMARLGAGCHVPAAAYAVVEGDEGWLWLRGLVASHGGQTMIRAERRGAISAAEGLGEAVAEDLLERGAGPLLGRE
jgi:hydroxymethylbilane synthase